MMSKKMQKRFEEVEAEFEEWKKKYSRKTIPSNLSEKKQQAFLDEVFLAKKGKTIWISGGGKVLLALAIYLSGRKWKDVLSDLKKKEQLEHYFDALKFRYREKLLGVQLLKKADAYALIHEGEEL